MLSPEARLLRDRIDLQDLVHRYALAVDEHDPDLIGPLFAEDAVLAIADPRQPSGQRIAVQGRIAIAQFIAELAQPGGEHFPGPTAHVIGAHVASVDGDTATGHTRCVAHHITDMTGEMLHRTSFLRYRDSFIRHDSGWQIQTRLLQHDFVSVQASGPPGAPEPGASATR